MSDEPIDTGLTVTVTTPAAPTPALPAVAHTHVPMPTDWDVNKVVALVRDVSQNMFDLPDILRKHKLSPAQYDVIKENEFFKRALEADVIEWNSPQSTEKRLALQSALALELGLPSLAARMSNTHEPLPGLVQLATLLTKIAGIGEHSRNAEGPREKFNIIFNLGADVIRVEKERAPREAAPVQPLPEGEGAAETLLKLLTPPGSPLPVHQDPQGS